MWIFHANPRLTRAITHPHPLTPLPPPLPHSRIVTGYLFLEFFLPVLLLFLALRALATFLSKATSLAFYSLEVGAEITKDITVNAIDALIEGG